MFTSKVGRLRILFYRLLLRRGLWIISLLSQLHFRTSRSWLSQKVNYLGILSSTPVLVHCLRVEAWISRLLKRS